MSKAFSLAELVPEPLTFADDALGGDGKTYDVKTARMLGAVDHARISRLLGKLGNYEGGEEAAAEFDGAVNEIVSVLVIGISPERVAAIPFGLKLAFANWWADENKVSDDDQGGATPGR